MFELPLQFEFVDDKGRLLQSCHPCTARVDARVMIGVGHIVLYMTRLGMIENSIGTLVFRPILPVRATSGTFVGPDGHIWLYTSLGNTAGDKNAPVHCQRTKERT